MIGIWQRLRSVMIITIGCVFCYTPSIYITKTTMPNGLELSCQVAKRPTGTITFNYDTITIDIKINETTCLILSNPKDLPTFLSCGCKPESIAFCNISYTKDCMNWTCAVIENGVLKHSEKVDVCNTRNGISRTSTAIHRTYISPNTSYGKDGTTEYLDTSNETINTLLDHTPDMNHITTLPGGNDTFYKKFVIIISASAVSLVSIAASLLIFLYRKYHHLSDALEATVAPVDDMANTTQNTNSMTDEIIEENRRSTVDIYESIPMMVLSPFADSFPLPQGIHILDTLLDSGSESSVGSVHFYETVPDSPNEPSTSGAEAAVSNQPPNDTLLYESLLDKRHDGQSHYNTIASSLSLN